MTCGLVSMCQPAQQHASITPRHDHRHPSPLGLRRVLPALRKRLVHATPQGVQQRGEDLPGAMTLLLVRSRALLDAAPRLQAIPDQQLRRKENAKLASGTRVSPGEPQKALRSPQAACNVRTRVPGSQPFRCVSSSSGPSPPSPRPAPPRTSPACPAPPPPPASA